jgi:hypothetical protein
MSRRPDIITKQPQKVEALLFAAVVVFLSPLPLHGSSDRGHGTFVCLAQWDEPEFMN